MIDCVFCGIASGAVEATIVAEADDWVAFRDLEPQAPVHVLVIPRAHISSLSTLSEGPLGTQLLRACAAVADAEGLDGGYRVVTNVGADGGQAVPHLHFHVLGRRRMGWPPG
ncbi:MAG: HIT domain-containing protein [Gemmatimonadetes bacterium]|nr:HIT domain-containing protein [Candidatus Palauibacter australiensis]